MLAGNEDYYNGMWFEILGFDILIDEALKSWLIEVNYSPSFKTETPLDNKIKQALIIDTFSLLGASPNNRVNYQAKMTASR